MVSQMYSLTLPKLNLNAGSKGFFGKYIRQKEQAFHEAVTTRSDEINFYELFINVKSYGNNLHLLQLTAEQEPIQRLWHYIEQSKTDKKIQYAAANAIAALNWMGVSFAGKDLRGVNIPTAYLQQGHFHRTNFTDANLAQVNFERAFLESALLVRADLKGTDFGQYHLTGPRENEITSAVCIASHGDLIAFGEEYEEIFSKKPKIHVWSLASRCSLCSWELDHGIGRIAFSSDGKRVISCGAGRIEVWEAGNGTLLQTLFPNYALKSEIEAEFSAGTLERLESTQCIKPVKEYPDYVEVSVDRENFVKAGIENLENILEFFSKKVGITGSAFSSHKEWVACSTRGGNIYIWDLKKSCLIKFICGLDSKGDLAFVKEDNYLVFHTSGKVHLLKIDTGEVVHTWSSPHAAYFSVIVSPNEELIVSFGFEGVVIWSFDDSAPIKILRHIFLVQDQSCELSDMTQAIAFSHDGTLLATGTQKELKIWNTINWDLMQVLGGNELNFGVRGLHFVGNDQYLLAIFGNEAPRAYKVNASATKKIGETHQTHIDSLFVSQDGKLVITHSARILRFWEGKTGEFLWRLGNIQEFAVSNDSQYLLVRSDKEVALWNLQEKVHVREFGRKDDIRGIGFLESGRAVIIRSEQIETYDPITGKWFIALQGKVNTMTAFAFSETGKWLAIGTQEGSLRVWNSTSGNAYILKKAHRTEVGSIKFHGEAVISSTKSEVTHWLPEENQRISLENCDEMKRIPKYENYFILRYGKGLGVYALGKLVHHLSVHPQASLHQYLSELDPDRIYLVDDFGRSKEWSNQREEICMADHRKSFVLSTFELHPKQPLLAVGGENGMIYLWDPISNKLLKALWGHTAKITKIVFCEEGEAFISISEDRTVQRWDISKGIDRATLTWRTEPYALILHWVNTLDVKTDHISGNFLFHEKEMNANSLAMQLLLGNEENYMRRPYVFPPDNESYFSDMEIHSYNIDQAIRILHHHILKKKNMELVKEFLTQYSDLIAFAPSQFHFLLKAIYSIACSIREDTVVDPISHCILKQILDGKVSDTPHMVREFLDLKLREVISQLLKMPMNIRPMDIVDMYDQAGNLFLKEWNICEAFICYSRCLRYRPSNAHIHLKQGLILLERENEDAAIQALQRATRFDPNGQYEILITSIKTIQGIRNSNGNLPYSAMFEPFKIIGLRWKAEGYAYCAKKYLEKAVGISETSPDDIEKRGKAQVLHVLGNICINLQSYDEAARHLLHGLQIRKEIYPSPHIELAKAFNSLGMVSFYQNEFKEAERWLQLALKESMHAAENEHTMTQLIERNISRLYKEVSKARIV